MFKGAAAWGLVTLFLAGVLAAQTRLTGRVVDQNETPVGGARITVTAANRPESNWQTVTDPTGGFSLTLPDPGQYLISIEREGFYAIRQQHIETDREPREITLVLNSVREVFQSLEVTGMPSPVDLNQTSLEHRLSGTDVVDVPYPASHSLRNGLKIMPGVLQDPKAGVHFNGAAEYQTLYLLDGFNIGDPVSGRFTTRLSVDIVHSLEFLSGRYSPEYGKGSAGVLAIQTETGGDQFHYTATNFFPGVKTNKGFHVSDWTPRFGVSGPIRKGRAWFSESLDAGYTHSFVNGLPKGQDDRSGWGGSNLARVQVNVTPANVFFADLLLNFDLQKRFGLAPLDPLSTTTDTSSRTWFYSFKDQIYLRGGVLLELGFAEDRVMNRRTPQGGDPYVIDPYGRRGNYFVRSIEHARRDQALANLYLPAYHLWGEHRIKTGIDLDRLVYNGDFRRTRYELLGLSAETISRTVFGGSGIFRLPNSEASSYVLDSWRLRSNLQIDTALRQDWDELTRHIMWSPRLSLAYAPFGSKRTRIAAGYAITSDPANLQTFSRPLDQHSETVSFLPSGEPAASPVRTLFTIQNRHLRMPRYVNWSLSLDRQLGPSSYLGVNYLRKRGRDGFAYVPAAEIYDLANFRRDRYDSIEITFHQSFSQQYELIASYIHSRAVSNAVLDLSVDQTLHVSSNFGPVPWDAPDRVLSWGYLPTLWKNWSVAYLADARSGFPFSVQDVAGRIVGSVNSHRYPMNLDLNLHLERRFNFKGYRFALRGGFNNLTGRANYTAVNNVAGSSQFLQFFGSEGRHFVVRLRLFGRAR